jgi:phosphoribosylamine--glycine ligase
VRVLVVGSGGREHALVRTLLRSPQAPEVLCTPGNAGIRRDARALDAPADDPAALARAAREAAVDLVVVGPEAPLVAGLADALAAEGVRCFGPLAAAARLEGSKAFAKEIMEAAGVPTAAHRVVTTVDEGLAAVTGYPTVIKADGLAAGKGVVIAAGEEEARAALEDMLVARRFGDQPVVVEEFLAGEELSLLALCDGERAVPLAPARDYKRIGDGDTGPNTGGMGSYSPVPGTDQLVREAIASVHQPVVAELARRGTPFHGVLYAGLMLRAGEAKVLEFNVRFGDPETQVVLPRLRSDLLELLLAATEPGGLAGIAPEWDPRAAVCVVLASRGYPEGSSSGDAISGLDGLPAGTEVFHAGTAERGDEIVTAGGRVLGVTALGEDRAAARTAAYAAADMIAFEGAQLRRDIASEAVMSPQRSGEAAAGPDAGEAG